jgi:flagellar P-ring protein FlgI
MRSLLLALLLLVPALSHAQASARLKDLVVLEGAMPVQLTGYGIVVGLDRTGDRASGGSGAQYTVQSIAAMLQRYGIRVDPSQLTARNTAAVMVTATLDPFAGPGGRLDVTVSALGDARSLSGGVLLQTPLVSFTGDANTEYVYATAQGPVSTGTLLAEAAGSSVRTGPTNTGRVPGGGLVIASAPLAIGGPTAGLVLRNPDFTNSIRVAEAINGRFAGAASAIHAGLVRVNVPTDGGGLAGLMAALETLSIEVDVPARVVVNERTGIVVAGGDVRIAPVMLTYGSLVIQTREDPVIVQPNAFGQGRTAQARVGSAEIDRTPARSVVLPPNSDASQLAAALNDLGLSAADVIGVFQALSRAGALQGELIVM